MTVPLVVIGSGIGFATLPTFSAQFARGETTEMRRSITAALRGVLFLSIPATLGLILLRQPLIAFLFERGQFNDQSVDMVAWALLCYTVGLVFHCVLEILVRAFFAIHDTKTPAFISAGAMALNVVFSITFPAWFARMGWMPLGGLAFAISLETAIETGTLFLLLRRRLAGIHGRELLQGAGAALLGTLGMSLALLLWLRELSGRSNALLTLGGVVLGGMVYALILLLLRVPELQQLYQTLARYFPKTSPRS
jgi:putative peptidoglycan lipid II flippase